MQPARTSLAAFLALLFLGTPTPAQPADSVRRDIEEAVLQELLTSDRLRELDRTPYADYVCVELSHEGGREVPAPEALLAPFEGSSPAVVPVSECRVLSAAEFSDAEPVPATSVHHQADGAPAILYRIGPVEWVRGDSASVRARYLVHPRHGEGYACDLRRSSGRWSADCDVRFVS